MEANAENPHTPSAVKFIDIHEALFEPTGLNLLLLHTLVLKTENGACNTSM